MGPVVPDVEIRLGEPLPDGSGELLVRGPNRDEGLLPPPRPDGAGDRCRRLAAYRRPGPHRRGRRGVHRGGAQGNHHPFRI
ncbi:hypothetical protein ACU4GD_24195 [Cupriavidus basilensis]